MTSPLQTMERIASQTVRQLPRRKRGTVPSCVHLPGRSVLTGRPIGSGICAMHPDRVWCQDCWRDHVHGHAWEDEYRCDHCGQHDRVPYGYGTFRRVKLRNLAGEVIGWPVAVGGFGLCQPCHATALAEVGR